MKRSGLLAHALFALALLAQGCSPTASTRVVQADVPRDLKPIASSGSISSLASSNDAFALDLYRSLSSQSGNLVFSPFSVSLALSMPYAGARGPTAAQMAQALHFDRPPVTLARTFNALDLAVTNDSVLGAGSGQAMRLEIANSTWADASLSFLPDYLDTLARDYGAGLRLADFIHAPEAARNQINAWVDQQTQQTITDLIPPGALDSSSRMVLVNAIYFKADWLTPFEPTSTRAGTFTRLDGSTVQASMMTDASLAGSYFAGEGLQALELPYAGGRAVMDLVLPGPGTFSEFERKLDLTLLEGIFARLDPTSVDLAMPKYKFASALDLGSQFRELGMQDALDPNLADFSGMTGGRDLFISTILHAAQVSVDEQGTEAAAATSVIMAPTMAMQGSVTVRLDRPFIFAIRDLPTGQILFLGRVLDPSQP